MWRTDLVQRRSTHVTGFDFEECRGTAGRCAGGRGGKENGGLQSWQKVFHKIMPVSRPDAKANGKVEKYKKTNRARGKLTLSQAPGDKKPMSLSRGCSTRITKG
jgi:hypothetical protein